MARSSRTPARGRIEARASCGSLDAYGLKETDNSELTIDQVVLVDVVEGSPSADRRVRQVIGDIGDPDFLTTVIDTDTASILAGSEVAKRIRWESDPRIERIVSTWPGELDACRANTLGLPSDTDFDDIIRQHMRDELVAAVSG